MQDTEKKYGRLIAQASTVADLTGERCCSRFNGERHNNARGRFVQLQEIVPLSPVSRQKFDEDFRQYAGIFDDDADGGIHNKGHGYIFHLNLIVREKLFDLSMQI